MKKSLLALILASIVAMSLSAQFTAETRLVIVNVSAKDKSGKPILTLKKEDVEVFEDGVRQEIKVFELLDDPVRSRRIRLPCRNDKPVRIASAHHE